MGKHGHGHDNPPHNPNLQYPNQYVQYQQPQYQQYPPPNQIYPPHHGTVDPHNYHPNMNTGYPPNMNYYAPAPGILRSPSSYHLIIS